MVQGRSAASPPQAFAPRTLLCRILGKQQTGDKWHYRSSSSILFQGPWDENSNKEAEKSSVLFKVMGGSVKGPHRCLRQPRWSALAQLPSLQQGLSVSATLLLPHPSLPRSALRSEISAVPALQFWFTRFSPMGFQTPPPRSRLCFPGVFEVHDMMPPAPAGKQSHDVPHRLTWWHWTQPSEFFFCPLGHVWFFFPFQTFVPEKYSIKSLIPLLLILLLSCRDNQSFWKFPVFFT